MQASEALTALERRLAGAGYALGQANIAGHAAVVARRSDFRLEWFASRMHTFVVVFETPYVDENVAEELTAAAQHYALKHKGGLPRGLQGRPRSRSS